MSEPTIPDEALHLILDSEGIDQPSRWPGGGSGITLGYGCDIGADPESLDYWQPFLRENEMLQLAQAKGKTGRDAAEIATRFTHIKVSEEDAYVVFTRKNLPREIARTVATFPGILDLPPQVLGAMVSIVFNRGTALDGDRRRELRAIRDVIGAGGDPVTVLPKIASQIEAMKRLWIGKGLDGLLARREAEAALVLSALQA